MSELSESPSPNLKRLTLLSKNVNDAINEIFSMAFTQACHHTSSPVSDQRPDIKLIEKNLWINRIMIPLASREKTLFLIQAFFRSETLSLTKAEIISAVYGVEEHNSSRYREAQEINLTKLLSRTRSFLEESLEHTYLPFPLDWLVFDIKTRRYCLYRIRTEILKLH